MTESDKMQASACQADAAQCAVSVVHSLRIGNIDVAVYWQRRAAYYAGMARYFMGMR